MPETCGAVDARDSSRVCIKPRDDHANHAGADRIGWPNPPERARRTVRVATKRGATDKDRAKGISALVDRIHEGRRGAEAFVRGEDPSESHQAIARYEPKRGTAKGRVLFYLRERMGQWIDAPIFTQPEVGGFAGTRRLRELREDGWPIETRPKPGDINTWQHRLTEEITHAGEQ